MNRRNALAAIGAASLVGLGSHASANDHAHHHSPKQKGASKAKYAELLASASHCVSTGEVCMTRCLEVMATGDTGMAECAQKVNQLIAVCENLQKLAAQNAALVPMAAQLGKAACEQCAESCKPHNDHHPECKDCYDACLDCAKHCDAII